MPIIQGVFGVEVESVKFLYTSNYMHENGRLVGKSPLAVKKLYTDAVLVELRIIYHHFTNHSDFK
jgi:hypothetical protein